MASKKNVVYSKEELMQMMNDHLEQQQEIANELRKRVLENFDAGENDKEKTKLYNHYLHAYNLQVEAVSKTASAMIKINGSSLATENEQKGQITEDLVD